MQRDAFKCRFRGAACRTPGLESVFHQASLRLATVRVTSCPGLPETFQVSALKVLHPRKRLCPWQTRTAGHRAGFHPPFSTYQAGREGSMLGRTLDCPMCGQPWPQATCWAGGHCREQQAGWQLWVAGLEEELCPEPLATCPPGNGQSSSSCTWRRPPPSSHRFDLPNTQLP